jgi:hypothetical protein
MLSQNLRAKVAERFLASLQLKTLGYAVKRHSHLNLHPTRSIRGLDILSAQVEAAETQLQLV